MPMSHGQPFEGSSKFTSEIKLVPDEYRSQLLFFN